MFRPRFLLAPLIALCCTSLYGAETGPILQFAMVDVRLAYDCLPAITAAPGGLIASKRDTGQEDALGPEPGLSDGPIRTHLPLRELKLAVPVEGKAMSLRPVATGRAPALGMFRTRLPSRYSSGAWFNLQSGYGDVLVEDRVGRARMSGAGFQDPNFIYLRLCVKF